MKKTKEKKYNEFLLDLYTINTEETYTDKLERDMNDDNESDYNIINDNDNALNNIKLDEKIINKNFDLSLNSEDLINKTNNIFGNDTFKNKKLLNNSISINKTEFNQTVLNSLNNDINTNITNVLNKTILESTLSSKFFKDKESLINKKINNEEKIESITVDKVIKDIKTKNSIFFKPEKKSRKKVVLDKNEVRFINNNGI